MRVYRNFAALILVVFLALANTACPFGGGKNETRNKTLLRATDDFAQAQIEAVDLIRVSRSVDAITDSDVATFKAILQDVNAYNQQAIDLGRQIIGQPDIPLDKQEELLKIIYQISNSLVRLNNAGITRIRDEGKRAAFTAIVMAMQAAASSVTVLLVKKG